MFELFRKMDERNVVPKNAHYLLSKTYWWRIKKPPVFGLVSFIFSLKVNQKVDIVSVVSVTCIISVKIYGVLLNKC